MTEKKIRILLAKGGLDGHTRGIKVLTRAFRDAGMEVIYTGEYQTVEGVVSAAIEEGVDVLGVSNMSSAHRFWMDDIMQELKKRGVDDICVVAGGIMAPEDIPYLESIGVSGNFGPGASLKEIIDHIVQRVQKERWKEG
jgi:methylmalonyl-CoA mutase C-terminal domain/subunit